MNTDDEMMTIEKTMNETKMMVKRMKEDTMQMMVQELAVNVAMASDSMTVMMVVAKMECKQIDNDGG